MKARMPGGPRKTITSLTVMVKAVERGMWPTPNSRDWKDTGKGRYGHWQLRINMGHYGIATSASFMVDFKPPTSAPFSHGGSGGELHKQVAPSGGPLNPRWVAWLMGFPIDWTSLPPSETRHVTRRERTMDSAVRQSVVESFNREWQHTFDAGVGLERAFNRLSEQMGKLSEAGCHMHLEFPEPLQTWWVAFRETRGDLIPHNPVEVPLG